MQVVGLNVFKDYVIHYTNGKPVITYKVDGDTHETTVVHKKGLCMRNCNFAYLKVSVIHKLL